MNTRIVWEVAPYCTAAKAQFADVARLPGSGKLSAVRLYVRRCELGPRLFTAYVDGKHVAGSLASMDDAKAVAIQTAREHGLIAPDPATLKDSTATLALAAFEFGYRCAEKGLSIQQATAEFHATIGARS